MNRIEAKQVLLNSMENDGHEWNDVVLASPKKGKCSWTKREVYDAIMEDRCVEGSDYNPIDSYLHYLKWKEEQKTR